MSVAPEVLTPDAVLSEGADIVHYYCCLDENTAICGVDVTDAGQARDQDIPCIVCDDLDGGWFCPLGKGMCPPEEE